MRARRWASVRGRPERTRSLARLAMWERSSSSMSRSRRERRKSVEQTERNELRSFMAHPRFDGKNTGAEKPQSVAKGAILCATKAKANADSLYGGHARKWQREMQVLIHSEG